MKRLCVNITIPVLSPGVITIAAKNTDGVAINMMSESGARITVQESVRVLRRAKRTLTKQQHPRERERNG
jgi:hypothetical protein